MKNEKIDWVGVLHARVPTVALLHSRARTTKTEEKGLKVWKLRANECDKRQAVVSVLIVAVVTEEAGA